MTWPANRAAPHQAGTSCGAAPNQAGTQALEKVRGQVWQDLRTLPDQDAARRFKGACWSMLKNPADLTDDQSATLAKIKRRGGDLWRAYALKEAFERSSP